MQTSILQELRYLISAKQGWNNREFLQTPLLPIGIPRGAITQICGFGKTEAAVHLIRENPELKTAWLEPQFELNPLGLAQRHLDLTRFLFAETGEHMVWTCQQVLKSGIFPIVVLKETSFMRISQEDLLLRKLQLAAEKSQTAILLLTEEFSASWPISLMLKAHLTNENVELEILRQRQ